MRVEMFFLICSSSQVERDMEELEKAEVIPELRTEARVFTYSLCFTGRQLSRGLLPLLVSDSYGPESFGWQLQIAHRCVLPHAVSSRCAPDVPMSKRARCRLA